MGSSVIFQILQDWIYVLVFLCSFTDVDFVSVFLTMPELIGFLCYYSKCNSAKLGRKCFSLTQCESSDLLYREHAPSTLTGKVNQLEVILRQLQTDLRKVRDH